jgi:hypothetical protein
MLVRPFCFLCVPVLCCSGIFYTGFTSLDFRTVIFLQRKLANLVSNPQPGGLEPCIHIRQWQGGPGTGFPFIAIYYSWGQDGGILKRFHNWKTIKHVKCGDIWHSILLEFRRKNLFWAKAEHCKQTSCRIASLITTRYVHRQTKCFVTALEMTVSFLTFLEVRINA